MTRPHFKVGIEELTEMAEAALADQDKQELEGIKQELAFRRPMRKARRLAKLLNCQTKIQPSTREQLAAQGQPVAVVSGDIASAFGLQSTPNHVEVL